MPTPIRIPNLLGGVSRIAQSLRAPNEFEEMTNVELDPIRGAQKRPGSQFIAGEGARSELTVEEPTNDLHFFWINRDTGEQFIGIVNPDVTDTDKMIQIFDISDGTEQAVEGDGNLNGTSTVLSNAENAALRTYLSAGSGDARRRLRTVTVEDASFILNRTVISALKGGALTYRNDAGTQNIRNQNSDQNKAAWSDFNQPPNNVQAATDDLTGPANIDNSAVWYARDDDVGQPTGFYWAISGTQPPWFLRIRTEGALSIIDEDTFPVRLDFDPGATPPFVLTPIDWTDRLSGDSTSNPGPSFIGNAIGDIVYHQDRLFLLSGDKIVSSRAGDAFNMFISSPILKNDADPIDRNIQGNRTAIIDYGFAFQDALVILTRGSRQVELRANGPLAPSTAFLSKTTDLASVSYAAPTSLGSRLYFLGERDFANIVYRYSYDPNAFSNTADEITTGVQGYIPAEASVIMASEAHQQLFIITDAETNAIYVYRTLERGRRILMNSWYKWEFDSSIEILTIQVFDDFLHILIRTNSRIYLERVPLGTPQQDTDNVSGPIQTMGYNIPIDRKTTVAGVYTASTDVTTWTLPYVDLTIDEVILGPAWDQDDGGDSQRLAGMRFTGDALTVTIVSDTTTLVVSGQFATNLLGDNAVAFAGRGFTKTIEFSEPFVRDQDGVTLQGNLQLISAVIRHKDTGFYSFNVTPSKRSTSSYEYTPIQIGSTDLDSTLLETFGEFQPRVLTRSRGSSITITNDKPVPSSIVDVEFQAEFVPQARSPIA